MYLWYSGLVDPLVKQACANGCHSEVGLHATSKATCHVVLWIHLLSASCSMATCPLRKLATADTVIYGPRYVLAGLHCSCSALKYWSGTAEMPLICLMFNMMDAYWCRLCPSLVMLGRQSLQLHVDVLHAQVVFALCGPINVVHSSPGQQQSWASLTLPMPC